MDGEQRGLEFLGTLGVGGFGAVYLANLHGRDRFVRRVAVKVMREGLEATADLVARQKDEARLLGLLAHDGIVQVIDLAEVDGRPAVVMEYVEGVDLGELLKALAERPPLHAALEIVAAVSGALDAAYNTTSSLTGTPLRVIHRDIKPANILLTTQGRVKVLDFGVAKADFARDGHTTNGGWGTPRFMSPEQWLGEPYGAPVDVYALGVTLFDLVADRPWERPPLARATFEASVARQLDQQPHIPEEIQRLIAQMTAFDPADRPLPADVHEALEGAIRSATGEPLSRFARRHVPALVEARSKQNAGQPLPASAALGSLSGAPVSIVPTPPAGATPPEPSLALASNPRPMMAGALMLGVMLATSLALVSAFGIWNLFEKDRAGAPVTAEPEAAPAPAPAPAPATAVAAPAAAPDVAPTIAAAPVTPSEPPPPTGSAPTRTTASRPRDPASPVRIEPTITAPLTTSSPPAAAAPAPVAAEPAPKPRAPAPTVVTWPVVVSSDPIGLDLWIDGEKVGSTPWSGQLTEGNHRVEVELDGVRSPAGTLAAGANFKNALRYYNKDQIWRTPK